MAAYIAKNADGEQVNLVEILPEQNTEPDTLEMEREMNLLGVKTRDE